MCSAHGARIRVCVCDIQCVCSKSLFVLNLSIEYVLCSARHRRTRALPLGWVHYKYYNEHRAHSKYNIRIYCVKLALMTWSWLEHSTPYANNLEYYIGMNVFSMQK